MPVLPLTAFLSDPFRGSVVSPILLVAYDSDTLELRVPDVDHRFAGHVLRLGQPTEWDAEATVADTPLAFVRTTMDAVEGAHRDESELRMELMAVAMTIPHELDGALYFFTAERAYPVRGTFPLIFRKGNNISLATLTAYDLVDPTAPSPNHRTIMLHTLRIQPVNTWWASGVDMLREILLQHFESVDEDALHSQNIQALASNADETVFRLSSTGPVRGLARGPLKTLR